MMRTLAISALAPAESEALTRQDSTHAESRVAIVTLAAARGLLLIALLAAPWAFGAVQVWAWATLTILAFGVLILWALGGIQAGVLRIAWSPLYVPPAFVLLLGLFQYYGHFTFDPTGTREALIKLGADLLFFFLAGQLFFRAPDGAWRAFGVSATALAFVMGMFAILQFFSSGGLIYWTVKTTSQVTFGPYVNHNHYAGLMEMLIPLSVAYVVARPPSCAAGILPGFIVLVPVASLLLSGSRGGFLSLCVEILIFAATLKWCRPARLTQNSMLKVGTALVAAALIFFWLDPGEVAKRLATVASLPEHPEATLAQRALVTRDSLRLFLAHPFIGTGLGSFEVAYPQYRSFATDLIWDHAHDDYAEALVEAGSLAGLLILAGICLFIPLAFRSLPIRLRRDVGWMQLGAAVGCCGLLVHSFSDFNLHIPANALWFAVCAALATQRRGIEPGVPVWE